MKKVIELSDEQINNCLVFLNRAELKGSEAEAIVMVKMALGNAVSQSEYLRTHSQKSSKTNQEGV